MCYIFEFNYQLPLLAIGYGINLFSSMEKFKIVVILLVLLFAQKVHCEQNNAEQPNACQNEREDELSFETNEFFLYNPGDLPSAQVLFNIIPEASSSSLANNKIKDSGFGLFHSNAKINHKLSIHKDSVFTRYCSVFGQIYLKTACFRL